MKIKIKMKIKTRQPNIYSIVTKEEKKKKMDELQKTVEHLLTDDFATFTPEEQENAIHYLVQLTPIEKKACAIAKEHLETSYDILKSNGFVDWLKEKEEEEERRKMEEMEEKNEEN